MFGIGMMELSVILVIILIIFGAGKLPEIGQGLGKCIKNFKKAVSGENEIEISSKNNAGENKKINNKTEDKS